MTPHGTMKHRDVAMLQLYQERFSQPFAVEAEPVGKSEGGYDVKFMPEIGAVALTLYAYKVYYGGYPISSEMGEPWMGEVHVDKVWHITGFQGDEGVVIELSDEQGDEPFELLGWNTVENPIEDLYENIESA